MNWNSGQAGSSDPEEPIYLREDEVAARWRMSPRTLQRWRHRGAGPPHLRINGRVLYESAEIKAFEARRRRPGADE